MTILFAIESGSRAWGFPSPDSDYDCRFVYAHPAAAHVTLQQPRDVIEFPIEGEIDAGGWDLRKALLLALGGNAVVVEWAKSPITYEEIDGYRARLIETLDRIVDPVRVAHHYLGLARSHIGRTGSFAGDVNLKKLFYLIRPIAALDWMAERDFKALPPMNLTECMAGTSLPNDLVAAINALIARKAVTHEMGTGPISPAIANYLETRYGVHEMNHPHSPRDQGELDARRHIAEAFYRETVEQFT